MTQSIPTPLAFAAPATVLPQASHPSSMPAFSSMDQALININQSLQAIISDQKSLQTTFTKMNGRLTRLEQEPVVSGRFSAHRSQANLGDNSFVQSSYMAEANYALLKEKDAQIEQQKKDIKALRTQQQQLESSARDALRAKDNELAKLEQNTQEHIHQLTTKGKEEVHQKEIEIERLRTRLAELRKQAEERYQGYTNKIADVKEHVAHLNREKRELNTRLQELAESADQHERLLRDSFTKQLDKTNDQHQTALRDLERLLSEQHSQAKETAYSQIARLENSIHEKEIENRSCLERHHKEMQEAQKQAQQRIDQIKSRYQDQISQLTEKNTQLRERLASTQNTVQSLQESNTELERESARALTEQKTQLEERFSVERSFLSHQIRELKDQQAKSKEQREKELRKIEQRETAIKKAYDTQIEKLLRENAQLKDTIHKYDLAYQKSLHNQEIVQREVLHLSESVRRATQKEKPTCASRTHACLRSATQIALIVSFALWATSFFCRKRYTYS